MSGDQSSTLSFGLGQVDRVKRWWLKHYTETDLCNKPKVNSTVEVKNSDIVDKPKLDMSAPSTVILSF